MRHMLITLPVAILLSVVACGDNDNAGMNGEDNTTTSGTTTEQTTAGTDHEIDNHALEDALKNDDREGFVREANQALDTAERELQSAQPADDASNVADLRKDIQDNIRVARDDLTKINASGATDWKDSGREIDRKVDQIENQLDRLTG